MALFQHNNQAQMVMLMNHMKNLQNQVMKAKPQKPSSNPSGAMQVLMDQMKTLQGHVMKLNAQPQPEKQSINATDPMQMMMTQMLLNNVNGKMEDGTSCIWVTGIPEEFADADVLCNIFGNYGNVVKVVFSSKKPDGALIQLTDPKRARLCCKYLDGVKLEGKRLSVRPSKIDRIFVKKSDEGKSKYFGGANTSRFAKVPSKFSAIVTKRLSWPTPVVLVSRIPEGKVDLVKQYIIESGYTVKNVEEGKPRKAEEGKPSKSEDKPTTMAFIELASEEEAVSVMGKLHNTMPAKIGEKNKFNRGLCFSFCNKKI